VLNPFLQTSPPKKAKYVRKQEKQEAAKKNVRIAGNLTQRTGLALWVGNLLIRMGKRLTEPNTKMNSSRQHA